MAAGEERRKQALLQGPIRRVQRRLNREVWARGLVVPAWCAGTALALYRFAFREHVATAGLLVVIAGVAAWIWRTRPSLVRIETAAALTDKSVDAGGLLLTRLEVPVGEWELSLNERVRRVQLPEVSVRGPLLRVGAAAVFTAAALLVPLPPKPVVRVNAAAASRVAQVEAKAEALAKERPLPEEQAELARLREELAQGRFDAADWEAADGLSNGLEQKAAQAASDLSKAEAAAKALEEGLAKGVPKDEEARERDSLERALMAVSGADGAQGDPSAQGDGADGPQAGDGQQGQDSDGQQGQDGDGQQGAQVQGADGKEGAEGKEGQGKQANGASGKQDANGAKGASSRKGARGGKKEISELRRALASRQRDLAKAFGQGSGSGDSDSEDGSGSEGKGTGPGKRRGVHPSRLVQQGKGDGSGESGDGQGAAGPGPGGGHNPLVYGGQAEVNPDRLKFQPLPKGEGGEAGELWGLQAADPKPDVEHARSDASGAAATGDRAPGTRTGPLLPRNRELVRRYFDSK